MCVLCLIGVLDMSKDRFVSMAGALHNIKQIFEIADIHGNGTIDKSELKLLMKEILEWEDDRCNALFEEADKTGDDMLNYNEFLDWLMAGCCDDKRWANDSSSLAAIQ